MREPDYDLADMHIHVMPQVDDGSESMEMTENMLRIASRHRIGTMILTPIIKEAITMCRRRGSCGESRGCGS